MPLLSMVRFYQLKSPYLRENSTISLPQVCFLRYKDGAFIDYSGVCSSSTAFGRGLFHSRRRSGVFGLNLQKDSVHGSTPSRHCPPLWHLVPVFCSGECAAISTLS